MEIQKEEKHKVLLLLLVLKLSPRKPTKLIHNRNKFLHATQTTQSHLTK